MTPRARRPGRRPGGADTRQEILSAAREVFAEKGFDAATIRAIAQQAGVDPALVHHYFGTKEQLFRATLDFPIDPTTIMPGVAAGGPEDMGRRLVQTFVQTWDSPAGSAGAALLRSAVSSDWTIRLLREFVTTQILRRVAGELKLPAPEARMRVSLVASQLAGLAMMRYIVKLEPLASMSADDVVALVAPTVQRYLTGDLPVPA